MKSFHLVKQDDLVKELRDIRAQYSKFKSEVEIELRLKETIITRLQDHVSLL